MKNSVFILLLSFIICLGNERIVAQTIQIPNGTNPKCQTGRTIGVCKIDVQWNAPGVKGREGKIWGTQIAHYGSIVLGFGSNHPSPWRAGADECTTMSFSTDVKINGRHLPAGSYGFFIELQEDSCELIFNKNDKSWGSYFYDPSLDVLRVKTKQQKNLPASKELLEYRFDHQKSNSVELSLEWEHWRIPFNIEVDLLATTLANIQIQLSGGLGFDPPSLQAAANWCLTNNVNLDQALDWIGRATNPSLGGLRSFNALSTQAGILEKLNKTEESKKIMQEAMDNATIIELHQYGRQLIARKQPQEAMRIFEMNYTKNGSKWPTHVGMMRGYSATGNLKKALEHAKLALVQAPDDLNKKNLEAAIETLQSGKAL